MLGRMIGLAGLTLMVWGGPAAAEIILALAGPLTGPQAMFGEQFKQGASKAIADINAKGGVLGQQLVMITGDDACDPKQARSVAEDLSTRKVAVVIGHFCSSSSIPASDVYQENGILQISPASTAPLLTERKIDTLFRACGRDDAQGPTAAAYILKTFKGKSIAVVHDKSAYGKGLADQVRDALERAQVKPVLYEAITANEKDYSALVTKLKSAKADLVFFGGYENEAGLIIRQMRDQKLTTVLMGGDALVSQDLWTITGKAGDGTLMTFSPDPRKLPQNAQLVRYYRDRHYEPEAYTLYTYGSIQAWAQAVEKAKTTDAVKVAAVLKSTTFETAIGTIGFNAKGDVTSTPYVVYAWKDGAYDVVAP